MGLFLVCGELLARRLAIYQRASPGSDLARPFRRCRKHHDAWIVRYHMLKKKEGSSCVNGSALYDVVLLNEALQE